MVKTMLKGFVAWLFSFGIGNVLIGDAITSIESIQSGEIAHIVIGVSVLAIEFVGVLLMCAVIGVLIDNIEE